MTSEKLNPVDTLQSRPTWFLSGPKHCWSLFPWVALVTVTHFSQYLTLLVVLPPLWLILFHKPPNGRLWGSALGCLLTSYFLSHLKYSQIFKLSFKFLKLDSWHLPESVLSPIFSISFLPLAQGRNQSHQCPSSSSSLYLQSIRPRWFYLHNMPWHLCPSPALLL